MHEIVLKSTQITLKAGQRLFLTAHACLQGVPTIEVAPYLPWPVFPVGGEFRLKGAPLFRVLSNGVVPAAQGEGVAPGVWVTAMPEVQEQHLPSASLQFVKEGLSLAWITLSDKGARGEREDTSGPSISLLAQKALDIVLSRGFIIPDEQERLKALLVELALNQRFDLVLTSGGTGLSPRDITPEATLAVLEKRLPGVEQAMTASSLQATPHGMLSRAVAGTLGGAVIVNLPGSPKAVAENLTAILPALQHGVEKLQGDMSDCGR